MENLLSTTQLAEKLNVHYMTVLRMVKAERIPFIKVGKTEFRFDLKKVMGALEKTTLEG